MRSRTRTPRSSNPARPRPRVARRLEQDEVRLRREHRRAVDAPRALDDPVALGRIASSAAMASSACRSATSAGGLRERAQVVREPHPLQVLHDRGVGQHVADPRAGERERLRERADDRDVRRARDERQRASPPKSTYASSTITSPSRRLGHRADRVERLGVARSGCWASRRTRRRGPRFAATSRRRPRSRTADRASVRRSGLRQPAQSAVEQVGRLEQGRPTVRTAVRLEELRQDLVRAVRGPDAVGEVPGRAANASRSARISPSG